VAAAEWAAARIAAAVWRAGRLSVALPVPLTYSEAEAWVVRVREVASWAFWASWVLVGSLPLLLLFVEPPFAPAG